MRRLKFKKLGWLMCGLGVLSAFNGVAAARPNLSYILADDMGYGDVPCLNPLGKPQSNTGPVQLYPKPRSN